MNLNANDLGLPIWSAVLTSVMLFSFYLHKDFRDRRYRKQREEIMNLVQEVKTIQPPDHRHVQALKMIQNLHQESVSEPGYCMEDDTPYPCETAKIIDLLTKKRHK